MTYRSVIVLGTVLRTLLEGKKEITIDELAERCRVAIPIVQNVLLRLSNLSLVTFDNCGKVIFRIDNVTQFLLSIVEHGLCRDLELLAEFVDWRIFEDLVCEILRRLGYFSIRRLRIPVSGRREEIDVVGIKEGLVLFIEVKHYRRSRLKLEEAVRRHLEKVKSCVSNRDELLKRIPVKCFYTCYCIPTVVTLRDYGVRLLEGVPIVPIYLLKNFLENLPFELDNVAHFIL